MTHFFLGQKILQPDFCGHSNAVAKSEALSTEEVGDKKQFCQGQEEEKHIRKKLDYISALCIMHIYLQSEVDFAILANMKRLILMLA